MTLIEQFLAELTQRWTHPSSPTLRVIGSTALMLRTDYVRGTKDSDVLETVALDARTKQQLLVLAGRGSQLEARWKLYLEIVPNGLPFLPHAPKWHFVAVPLAANTLRIEALDVVDVVVSKLKRFHTNDRSDISAMIARDLVAPHFWSSASGARSMCSPATRAPRMHSGSSRT
jgi:hypothetical protein